MWPLFLSSPPAPLRCRLLLPKPHPSTTHAQRAPDHLSRSRHNPISTSTDPGLSRSHERRKLLLPVAAPAAVSSTSTVGDYVRYKPFFFFWKFQFCALRGKVPPHSTPFLTHGTCLCFVGTMISGVAACVSLAMLGLNNLYRVRRGYFVFSTMTTVTTTTTANEVRVVAMLFCTSHKLRLRCHSPCDIRQCDHSTTLPTTSHNSITVNQSRNSQHICIFVSSKYPSAKAPCDTQTKTVNDLFRYRTHN